MNKLRNLRIALILSVIISFFFHAGCARNSKDMYSGMSADQICTETKHHFKDLQSKKTFKVLK